MVTERALRGREDPVGADDRTLASVDAAPAESRSPAASRGDPAPFLAARARQVVPQIVDVLRGAQSGEIELRLSPEELGHVRISLAFQDGAAHLTIQSERPDTAELLRRHSDLLRSELQSLGYDSVDIDFASGSGAHNDAEPQEPGSAESDAAAPSGERMPAVAERPALTADRRLNLRL
jgi:flagellar hook-length control protein FliK